MEIKDIIDVFDATAAQQMRLWSIYWVVAIGILGFLWKEHRKKELKVVLVLGFIFFAVSNLYAIQTLQKGIIEVSIAIDSHLHLQFDSHPDLLPNLHEDLHKSLGVESTSHLHAEQEEIIPAEFRKALRKNSTDLKLVMSFHLICTFAFSTAMLLAKTVEADQLRTADA